MREVQAGPSTAVPNDRLLSTDFVLVCSSNFLFWVTVYSFLVTLPVYSVVLGGSAGQAGLVTAAQTLVSFSTAPHAGRHVNRFGRTTFMRLGLGILLGLAIALHFVSSLPLLVVVGGLSGVGVALFQSGSATLVADLAPAHRRGEAMGIFGTFTTVAVALSSPISIFVMQNSGFSALFIMTGLLAAISLTLSLFQKEPPRRVAAARARFFNPRALLPGFGIFAISLTYGAFISFLPGETPKMGLENAGLFFTVFAISSLLVRALSGTFSDRVGRLPVLLPALLVAGIATALLGLSNAPGMLLGMAFLYGLGYGAAYPTAMALAVDRGGQSESASSMATFNASYSLGIAVGSLGMGILLTATSFGFMTAVAGVVPVLAMVALYLGRSSPATSER